MKTPEFKQTEIGKIPEDWDIDKLENYLIIKGRIGWKGLKKSEYLIEGYAIINGEQVVNNSIDWASCGKITKERYDESPEIMLKEDDILMTKDGTIGKLAYINALQEPATVASGIFVIRNNSPRLNQRYLFYYFKSPVFANLVKSRTEGSVVSHLYQRDITQLLIPLPPAHEQQEIANTLIILDLKIENNRKINETLEKIGKALFKHWFIDFEYPNEKGEPYKSSGGKMVDSELGTIPGGWRCEKLGDVVLINHKSINEGYQEKIIQYIDISSVSAGKLETVNTYNLEEAPSRAKRLVAHGDVIWSCVRPNRKSYLFIHKPPKNLVVSTGFAVLTPKGIPPSFLYCWVTTDEFVDYLAANADGSAYPAVRPEHFSIADILLPPAPLLSRFENVMAPLMEKIAYNEEQCRTLCIIRDMLLPSLMSGQIRVPAG